MHLFLDQRYSCTFHFINIRNLTAKFRNFIKRIAGIYTWYFRSSVIIHTMDINPMDVLSYLIIFQNKLKV